jgi:diguanylate cyclase (GGDEF)-like protein
MGSASGPRHYVFTPPRNRFFRWLTEPGEHLPPGMRRTLLGEILTSPVAVLMGVFNAFLVSGYAVVVLHAPVFVVFIILDLIGSVFICHAAHAASRGQPIKTDIYLWTSILWCVQQGGLAFVAMRSGMPSLQLLAATLAMGLMGPACARHYATPRYALLLISLIELPLVIGAALSGTVWGTILVIQAPPFLFGSFLLVRRLHALAVSNLMARHESLHNATHDVLTGVLNRAGFGQVMATIGPASIPRYVMFYLDLDGFKAVNDSLGHDAGDRLLTEVADRMKSCLQPGDVIARLGGDEFLIVAYGMSPAAAADFAHGLIRRVSGQAYDLGDPVPVSINVSMGFACCPDDGDNPDSLRTMADAALYDAKAAGKGTVQRFRWREGAAPVPQQFGQAPPPPQMREVTADRPPASSTPASIGSHPGSYPP